MIKQHFATDVSSLMRTVWSRLWQFNKPLWVKISTVDGDSKTTRRTISCNPTHLLSNYTTWVMLKMFNFCWNNAKTMLIHLRLYLVVFQWILILFPLTVHTLIGKMKYYTMSLPTGQWIIELNKILYSLNRKWSKSLKGYFSMTNIENSMLL